jgi:hypothetical protein
MENKIKKEKRIFLSPTEERMIEQLKEALIITHSSQVIRTAIRRLYIDTFKPYYANSKRLGLENDILPTSKSLVSTEEIRGTDICEKLDGEILTDKDGQKICKFKTYAKAGANVYVGENSIELENLTNFYVDNQYKGGTKAEIQMALMAQKEREQNSIENLPEVEINKQNNENNKTIT